MATAVLLAIGCLGNEPPGQYLAAIYRQKVGPKNIFFLINWNRYYFARFTAIVFPLYHLTAVRRTNVFISAAWLLAVASSLPQVKATTKKFCFICGKVGKKLVRVKEGRKRSVIEVFQHLKILI